MFQLELEALIYGDEEQDMGLKQQLRVTRRRRILGLPIGPKETDWVQVARLGAAAATTGAASIQAVRRIRSANGAGEKAEKAVEGTKDVAKKGKEAMSASS